MELTSVFFNLIFLVIAAVVMFVIFTSLYYARRGNKEAVPAPVVRQGNTRTVTELRNANLQSTRSQVMINELDSRRFDYNFDNLKTFENPVVSVQNPYPAVELINSRTAFIPLNTRYKINNQFR